MTPDLDGRIGPEDLVDPPKKAVYIEEEDGPLELDELDEVFTPAPERARASITFRLSDKSLVVEGFLANFSFGKGWLCGLESVDEDAAVAMAKCHAVYKNLAEVIVEVKGVKFNLKGDLDFTLGYGFSGCTFAVSADEGSYVDA